MLKGIQWSKLVVVGLCLSFLSAGASVDTDAPKSLAVVELNDKSWYIDKDNRMAIPTKFERAWTFFEGLAMVENAQKERWYIDVSGKAVTPKYQSGGHFSEGLAAVKSNGKWGYIEKDEENGIRTAVPARYWKAFRFSEGLGLVILNRKYGFVCKTGDIAIPLQYEHATSFSEGLALVKENGTWKFIDKDNQTVLSLPEYDDVFPFSEGYAAVKKGDSWGFINKDKKVVIPIKYQFVNPFKEGYASFTTQARKHGIMDKAGKEYRSPRNGQVSPFSEGLAAIITFIPRISWGFIKPAADPDSKPKFVVRPKYRHASAFSQGLAAVQLISSGKMGYINKKGKMVIPASYDMAYPFSKIR